MTLFGKKKMQAIEADSAEARAQKAAAEKMLEQVRAEAAPLRERIDRVNTRRLENNFGRDFQITPLRS